MSKHAAKIGGYWEAVWGSIAGSVVYFIFAQIVYFTIEFISKRIFNYSISDIYFKLILAVDNIILAAILFFIFLVFFIILIGIYLFARAIGCRCALSWGNFAGAKLTSKYLLRFDLAFISLCVLLFIILAIESLLGIMQAENMHINFLLAYFIVSLIIPSFLARCYSNFRFRKLML